MTSFYCFGLEMGVTWQLTPPHLFCSLEYVIITCVRGESHWSQCCQSWWDAGNALSRWNHSSLSNTQHRHLCGRLSQGEWQNEEMSEIVPFGKYWALVASLFHRVVLQACIIPQLLQLLFKEFCLADDKTKHIRALWFTHSWKSSFLIIKI